MLLETHKLLTIFKELIPFKSTVTLSLSEKNLVIQVLFRKEKITYYYLEEFSLEYIYLTENETKTITAFIEKLKEFHKNAKKENCQESKLINQIVDWKGEN